jgi:replicative DNA helicase
MTTEIAFNASRIDAKGSKPPKPDGVSETWILSSMMAWPKVTIDEVRSVIQEEAFRMPFHAEIAGVIFKLSDEGKLTETWDVIQHLNNIGRTELANYIIGAMADGKGWATTAHDLARRLEMLAANFSSWKLWVETTRLQKQFDSGAIDATTWAERLQVATYECTQKASGGDGLTHIKSFASQAIENLEQYAKKGQIVGVPTGFTKLDNVFSGLKGGQLVILAARPSIGKSALAVNFAVAAARADFPTAIFTLEMGASELLVRMICSDAKVGIDEIKSEGFSRHCQNKLNNSAGSVTALPIYIDETSSISINALRTRARMAKEKHNLGLIVIDYLQLAKSMSKRGQENRHLEIAEITGGLKSLAKELNIPVIALSQLNREVEKRKGGKPQLSDLRESGSIEQDADIVMLLHREKKAPSEIADVLIAKNRGGVANVVVQLWWDGSTTKFNDYTN